MNEQTKAADTVTITAAKYKNMIDKDDFCITAERLESAIMLLYDMQDEYFRALEPTHEPASADNAAILYGFSRYRTTTNAIAELLQLIKEDFEGFGIMQ